MPCARSRRWFAPTARLRWARRSAPSTASARWRKAWRRAMAGPSGTSTRPRGSSRSMFCARKSGRKYRRSARPRALTRPARLEASFDNVELLLVGREAKPIRPVNVAGNHRRATRLRVEPIDIGRQLGGGHVTLVVAEDAERRIGEPDRI